eukprot:1401094-Prymnesium_polylepis.1
MIQAYAALTCVRRPRVRAAEPHFIGARRQADELLTGAASRAICARSRVSGRLAALARAVVITAAATGAAPGRLGHRFAWLSLSHRLPELGSWRLLDGPI